MKCPNCSKVNPKDSNFCEDCGLEFSKRVDKQEKRTIADEFDDVVFTPTKENHGTRNVIIIVIVLLVGLWILLRLGSSPSQVKTGAQEDSTTTVSDTQPTTFPISYLHIEDQTLDWIGTQLYFKGIIKNYYSKAARNISVRIDFYKDKLSTLLFDTRYITIVGVPDNGAFSFQIPVYAYPDKQFWWKFNIVSAEF